MAENKNVQIMTADAFAKEAERGVHGAFLFFGEEDFVKERRLAALRKTVMTAEGFEAFNHFKISFSGASPLSRDEIFSSLYDAVDAMPMMQDQKFIEVRDLSLEKIQAAELDALVSACRKAGEDTVLIIFCRESELLCGYRFDQSATFKKISSVAVPVRFTVLTKGKLVAYAKKVLAAENVTLTDAAADTLCDMCALKMTALTGELSKISAYASTLDCENKTIDETTVRDICSESAAEEEPFALVDAMQKWNVSGMLDVLARSKDMREEPIAVVAKMARVYVDMLLIKSAMNASMSSFDISKKLKMNAYRVDKYVLSLGRVPIDLIGRALEKLYELDLKLKSTQSDAWTMIECFVSDIYMPKSLR